MRTEMQELGIIVGVASILFSFLFCLYPCDYLLVILYTQEADNARLIIS